MHCPTCRHENPPQAKFCLECGTRIALSCSRCRAELPPSAKFCLECGERIAAPNAAIESRFSSPESYTPRHIAERILTSRVALEGERKLVTVLFADLKGSMELLADRDPEDARKILDPVLELMMEAVHRYEGTVNQVMGDGIMALFGAPLAHEDHAVRACYAALRMQGAIATYARDVFQAHGVPIQIRVGINSGDVVVRSIGSDLRMDYSAVGQTTHLAARMEQMATPGTILLAPATLSLAEGYVDVASKGRVAVKGLPDAVEVFELLAASSAPSRLHGAARRGLTRFVGRDAEMEALRRGLARAGSGRGQVVGVIGEPGVGKSRLFHEFTRSHRTQDWLVLEASSVSYGKATSYLPLIDLLKRYFKIGDRDSDREIQAKVTGTVLTLDRALEPAVVPILALLDATVDEEWKDLDPHERRRRSLDAVRNLLLRECRHRPLLLVFEDLHWIDPETQALLDALVESLPATPLLLLVNYRPEYGHPWGNKTYYTQVHLDALPLETAGELLDGLLGPDPSVVPLKLFLSERTGGNPLFLEESVRSLAEISTLTGERGAHRLTRPLDTVQVPATVQAILAARIDRLPPEEKALLQCAAVIGKDVPFALLRGIVDTPDDALRRGLTHLVAAEFVYETSLFPDLEYTFKHALTHEVAYGSLLHQRRRPLHARVVDTIEKIHAERLDDQVERLAHHALHAEMWERAATYARRAGTRAAAQSANRAARERFLEALEALRRLPETTETLEAIVDVHLQLRGPLFNLGEFDQISSHMREAEGLARRLGDVRRQGIAANYLSSYHWGNGDLPKARRWAELNLALAERGGDEQLRTMALYNIGRALFAAGAYRRSVQTFRSMTGAVSDFRAFDFSANACSWICWALAALGEFDEAIAEGQRGIEISRTPGAFVQNCTWLGRGLLIRGDLPGAAAALERALAAVEGRDMTLQSHLALLESAYRRSLAGESADDACAIAEASVRALRAMGMGFGYLLLTSHYGETLLRAGRRDDAIALGHETVGLVRRMTARGAEAAALLLLGDAAAADGDGRDDVQATQNYREALALAEELSMRPAVAHCHAGLARICFAMRMHAEAEEHLGIAIAMYREMGMSYWLERLQNEGMAPA